MDFQCKQASHPPEVKMSGSRNPCETSSPLIVNGERLLVLLAVCLVLSAAGPLSAEAGSRGAKFAIGAGILGAIILNGMRQTERNIEKSPSRKTVASRSDTIRGTDANGRRQTQPSRIEKTQVAHRAKPKDQKASKTRIVASRSKATIAPGPFNQRPMIPGTYTERAALPGAVDNAAGSAVIGVGSGTISTPAEIESAQHHLKYLGYDVPSVTGVLDPKTKIAIAQFQESIGVPSTGALSVEQLQALFVRAAGQAAAAEGG
jgi:Putative peptidoglycan binding domain